jgi:hypothetical protein
MVLMFEDYKSWILKAYNNDIRIVNEPSYNDNSSEMIFLGYQYTALMFKDCKPWITLESYNIDNQARSNTLF